MRLIDADALKELRHGIIQGRIKFDGNEYDIIDICPTIDAVEVVHAKWIVQDAGITHFMCSSCKAPNYPQRFNYCPECGAKMD